MCFAEIGVFAVRIVQRSKLHDMGRIQKVQDNICRPRIEIIPLDYEPMLLDGHAPNL